MCKSSCICRIRNRSAQSSWSSSYGLDGDYVRYRNLSQYAKNVRHAVRTFQTVARAAEKNLIWHEVGLYFITKESDGNTTLRHRFTGLSCVLPPDVVWRRWTTAPSNSTSVCTTPTVTGFDPEAWSNQNIFPRLDKVFKRQVSDDMGATWAVSDGTDEASSVGTDTRTHAHTHTHTAPQHAPHTPRQCDTCPVI